jgi:hypothetical protein
MIAYRDWLRRPTAQKKMLASNIKTRWYSIIESTESTRSILGPQAKFRENNTCEVNKRDKNIGAMVVEGRGMRNISFVSNLNKSASI